MVTTTAILALVVFGAVVLALKARRDHREILALRSGMLDDCARLLSRPKISIGPDSFPALTGELEDGRTARVDLIADTLVTRRLPQLWLRLTVIDETPRRDFSIGALARATGAEFYSIVANLPERVALTSQLPIVARGANIPDRVERNCAMVLERLFSDAQLKEAVAKPGGLRIVRQTSQGDRASHLVLRQVRFGISVVPAEILRLAIDDALALEQGLAEVLTVRAMEIA
jgi:hypothetical protein